MKTVKFTSLSVLALIPLSIPAVLFTAADNTPESEWNCAMARDITFVGDDVTVKTCTSYGVDMSRKIWNNREARLVCLTYDPDVRRLYADEESDFGEVRCKSVELNSVS